MPIQRYRLSIILILILGARPLIADDLPESYQSIEADWKQEREKCVKAVDETETDADKTEAWKLFPNVVTYSQRFLNAAKANPSDAGGRSCLLWIVFPPGGQAAHDGALAELQRSATDLLLHYHADDLEVAVVAMRLDNIPAEYRDTLLKGLVEKADSRDTKAIARAALAQYLIAKSETAEKVQPLLAAKRDEGSTSLNAYQIYILACDFAAERRKATELFEEVISEYEDVVIARPQRPDFRPGKFAKAQLDKLRNLAIGMPAPDIDGVDLNGKPLRLADYRGKVVLLVFWASWCGPCVAEIPHERELVERFKEHQFALLGINGDEDKSAAQKVIEEEKVNWLNWNDPVTAEAQGPIVNRFYVDGWPATFLLDSNGIIRAKDVRGDELEKLINQLLNELKSPSPTR